MDATVDYLVTGMTCGHCVSAVTSELSALDGAVEVSVDLLAGGVSTVRVTSHERLVGLLAAPTVEISTFRKCQHQRDQAAGTLCPGDTRWNREC